MTKTLTAGMTDHLSETVTTLAMCWHVTRTDGTEFFFTNHDQNLVVNGDTYIASTGFQQTAVSNSTGLSVANLEVEGVLDSESITEIELRAGKFDFAYIEVFMVDWAPSLQDGHIHSFDFSAQGYPNAVDFNADRTKMYIGDYDTNKIFQYSLSSPNNVNSAVYDTVFLDTTTETSGLVAFKFNSDGTILYAASWWNNTIYQYTVGTPYDLSTAVYSTLFFDASDVIYSLNDLFFSPDGTTMYLVSYTDSIFYQYTLGTPWDISSVVPPPNHDFTAQISTYYMADWDFNSDGSKLYMGSVQGGSIIYQYTLGTLYDLETASYDTVSHDFSVQVSNMCAFRFKADGTKIYIADANSNIIYQYTLGTPWVISSASYDTVVFDATAQVGTLHSMRFKPDGTKMYLGAINGDSIFQYSLGTSWVVSSATYDSKSFDTSGQVDVDYLYAFNISPDGAKLYAWDSNHGITYQYPLGTAWDISTASYAGVIVNFSINNLAQLQFNSDGTEVYIADLSASILYSYSLNTPWDLATINNNLFNADAQVGSDRLYSVALSTDGTKLFLGSDNNNVYQYTLSTPFVVCTAAYDSISFEVSADLSNFKFSENGQYLYIANYTTNFIDQYELTSNWDISDVVQSLLPNVNGQISLRAGRIGEVFIPSNGGFKAELRGLAQQFSQQIVEVYTPDCRTDLGSTKCKIPITPDLRLNSYSYSVGSFIRVPTAEALGSAVYEDRYYECTTAGTSDASQPVYDTTIGQLTTDGSAVFISRNAWTRVGIAVAATDRRSFTATISDARAVDGWFNGGVIVWETGDNVGAAMEVKDWINSGGALTLFLGMPYEIQSGDAFRIYPGCDKRSATCIAKFNNIINFRGEPHVPGNDQFLQYPDAV